MEWWRAGHLPGAAAWGYICCTVPSSSFWLRVNESCDLRISKPVAEHCEITNPAWVAIRMFDCSSCLVLRASLYLQLQKAGEAGNRADLLRLQEYFVTDRTAGKVVSSQGGE